MNNLQCFSIYPRDLESFPQIPKLCKHKTVIPERTLKYLEQMRQKEESSDDGKVSLIEDAALSKLQGSC